jgi:hypothetical protein
LKKLWRPKKKYYYTSFGGNAGFPMAVFSENGKRISREDLTPGFDMRGILNIEDQQIECCSRNTGLLAEVRKLPSNAPTDEWMCLSFTNNTVFLFDKVNRVWVGYR